MEKRPSQNNVLLALGAGLLVIAIGAAGFLLRNASLQSSNASTLGTQVVNDQVFDLPVSLVDSEGNKSELKMNANVGETLFSVIQRYDVNNDDFKIEYQEYEGMGAFITNFNDITFDVNSQFWELLVNGQQSLTGISDYLVKKGDVITFQVTSFN